MALDKGNQQKTSVVRCGEGEGMRRRLELVKHGSFIFLSAMVVVVVVVMVVEGGGVRKSRQKDFEYVPWNFCVEDWP